MTPAEAAAAAWQADLRTRCALLTAKEVETLLLLAKGYTGPQVARILGVALKTHDCRCASVRRKLAADTTLEAAVLAAKAGIV